MKIISNKKWYEMLSSKDLAFHNIKRLDRKYTITKTKLDDILATIGEILESKPKKQDIIETLKELYAKGNK